MAKEATANPPKPTKPRTKLPKLPSTHKIKKRPLLHPPIASPRASSSTQKTVYVSARSPFISTIKRVRKLLSQIESRASGPISLSTTSGRSVHKQIEDSLSSTNPNSKNKRKRNGKEGEERNEEVVLKATGKAIEKLLQVAVWMQGQEDLKVRFMTGSVGAVDDVVAREDEGGLEESSRVRRTSCLEVLVALR